jgi:hypothetical protein
VVKVGRARPKPETPEGKPCPNTGVYTTMAIKTVEQLIRIMQKHPHWYMFPSDGSGDPATPNLTNMRNHVIRRAISAKIFDRAKLHPFLMECAIGAEENFADMTVWKLRY